MFFFKFQLSICKPPEGRVNTDQPSDKAKIVHMYDIEDLDDKVAFCRCWKSKKVLKTLDLQNKKITLKGLNFLVGPSAKFKLLR